MSPFSGRITIPCIPTTTHWSVKLFLRLKPLFKFFFHGIYFAISRLNINEGCTLPSFHYIVHSRMRKSLLILILASVYKTTLQTQLDEDSNLIVELKSGKVRGALPFLKRHECLKYFHGV